MRSCPASSTTPPVMPLRRGTGLQPTKATLTLTTASQAGDSSLLLSTPTAAMEISNSPLNWWEEVEEDLQDERHIDFDEGKTVWHRDPMERSLEEWYTAEELADMKRQAMTTARQWVTSQRASASNIMTWPRALGAAYHSFLYARAVNDLQETLAMVTQHVHLLGDDYSIEVLGLERWTVSGLRRDRTRRRHAVAREVQYRVSCHQHNHYDDESEDESSMGDICREISRPSRMFAFHIGRMLAMQVGNEEE